MLTELQTQTPRQSCGRLRLGSQSTASPSRKARFGKPERRGAKTYIGPRPEYRCRDVYTLLFYQLLYFRSSVFDFDGVIRLFPEHLPLGVADHQTVAFEAERLDRFRGIRRSRIDVLSLYLTRKFRLEPAHGGLDLSADGSTRQEVISNLQRGGRLGALCGCCKADTQGDKPNRREPDPSCVAHQRAITPASSPQPTRLRDWRSLVRLVDQPNHDAGYWARL